VVTNLLADGLFYVLFSKNILMKLIVGFQQPTCLRVNCQDGIRGWKHFAFM